MTSAVIKLESFNAPRSGSIAPVFSRAELDQAKSDGIAEGISRSENAQIESLRAGLDRLAASLDDEETRRSELRAEAVAALAPVLSEMLDALTPAAMSQRLERDLSRELQALAAQATPVKARISCNDTLRGMVQNCIEESGISGIELTHSTSERISLSLQGGHIEFSQEKISRQIRALVDEIKQDDTTWTH